MFESSIERFISLGNNCSNLYENESFGIPLSLKCLFYYNLSFLYQIYNICIIIEAVLNL